MICKQSAEHSCVFGLPSPLCFSTFQVNSYDYLQQILAPAEKPIAKPNGLEQVSFVQVMQPRTVLSLGVNTHCNYKVST